MALTVVIGIACTAQAQPWGWWDEDDSIARPLPPRDSLECHEGRLRLTSAASDRMRRTRMDYDAAGRIGPWQATLAGRDDSGWSPVRQRASWTESGMAVQAGDLTPWNGDPLLEGASRRSGAGHPMSALGTGNGVSGIDVLVEDESVFPWDVSVRSRVAASTEGRSRSSTMIGAGAFRAGLTTTRERSRIASGGLRVAAGDAQVDASMLLGDDRFGMLAALSSTSGSARHSIEVRKVDRGLAHDGLPQAWSGATHAQAESRWRGETSSFGVSGDVGEDSSGRRRMRTFGDLSGERGGFEARLRSKWSRTSSGDAYRLTPGLARASGEFRPWMELACTSDQGAIPSFGAAWKGRDLRAEASASLPGDDGWTWRVSSSLGRDRSFGSSRLEIGLSGGETSFERGDGTWVTSW